MNREAQLRATMRRIDWEIRHRRVAPPAPQPVKPAPFFTPPDRVTGPEICSQCGHSHAPENRRRLIKPMRDAEPIDIADAWPCFYAYEGKWGESSAARLLYRDLAALNGATR